MIELILVSMLENYVIEPDYYICIQNEATQIYECEDNSLATEYDDCIKMHNILLCEIEGVEI
jgi:hypothetical protein